MINTAPLKEALKRVNAADRALSNRDTKLAAKREEASDLFAQAKAAEDPATLSEVTKKLNRANAIVDQMVERGHTGTADLADALDKLIETAQAERAKLS